jgi:Tfp pilus assembly protein PilO
MKRAPQDVKRILCWSVAACFVLDLALAAFLLSPWSPSKAAGEQRLNDLTLEYQTLAGKVKTLDRLQGRLRTSQKQIETLQQTSMPAEREVSSTVLAEVHRIAESSHVYAEGMSLKPDQKTHEGLRKVEMKVMVTGDYASVVQFINGIERSPIFFVIDGVSASVGRANQGEAAAGARPEGTIHLLVSLETYVQADGSPAGNSAQGGQKA